MYQDLLAEGTKPWANLYINSIQLQSSPVEGDVLTCQDEKGTAAWAPPPGTTSTVAAITAVATGGAIDGTSVSFSFTKTGQQVTIAMPTTIASQLEAGTVELTFNIPADFAPSDVYGLGAEESNSINWYQQTFDAEGEPDNFRISNASLSFNDGTSYTLTFAPQDEDLRYSGSGNLILYGSSFTYATDS